MVTPRGKQVSFAVRPIGSVTNCEKDVFLKIDEEFRPGLKQLNEFSHVVVLWWATGHDNPKSRTTLQSEPPYARGHVTGVSYSP